MAATGSVMRWEGTFEEVVFGEDGDMLSGRRPDVEGERGGKGRDGES